MTVNLNYEEEDYNTIFANLIAEAQQFNIISEDEDFLSHINDLEDIENVFVLNLAVYASELATNYKKISDFYNDLDIDSAGIEALISLGEKFNISIIEAKSSIVSLTFTLSEELDYDLNIPEFTVIETSKGEQFLTTGIATILAGQTELEGVEAKSEITGYNSHVAENTLNLIKSDIPNVEMDKISVTNPKQSKGGKRGQTVEEYRDTLKKWYRIFIKGSKDCFDYYLSDYDGIESYVLVPHWNGAGTLKIIVDCPETMEYLAKLSNYLVANAYQYKDDDVLLKRPTSVDIACSVSVNVDIDRPTPYSYTDKENLKLSVENTIITYINGGYRSNGEYYTGLGIGEDFIPFKCAVFLNEEISELKNVKFTNEDNTVVKDDEKAVAGDINVSMDE